MSDIKTTSEPSEAASDQGKQKGNDALVPLGYLFAVLVPFVGLVLGIIAATRSALSPRKHGPWIIAVATLAFAGWGILIYTQVHSTEHHAAVQAEEGLEHARQEQAEVEEKGKEATEKATETQYCAEHPGAGEHTAGGQFYYNCGTEP